MGLFKKKKAKSGGGREDYKKKPNKCWTCAKHNTVACPYGVDTYCISCDAFVLVGFGDYSKISDVWNIQPNIPACPNCGSCYIRSAGYSNRLECRSCGKIFT